MGKLPRGVILLVPLVLSLLTGFGGYFFGGKVATRLNEENLIRQANTVVASLNPARINSLTGTESDLNNADYLWLKQQLTMMGATFPHLRYLYLMGVKDNGTVFFYLDTEPEKYSLEGSGEPLAQPGEVYVDADPGFAGIFQSTTPKVWPKSPDRWGSFVSVTLPLSSFQLNKSVVLGMDIESSVWDQNVNEFRFFPFLLAVSLTWLLFFVVKNYFDNLHSNRRILEQENRFKAVVEAARDAIIMMNQSGETVLWNRAAQDMFGYSPEEVLGKKFHQLIVTKPEHKNEDRIIQFGQTGESKVVGETLELPVKRKDGTEFIIELTVARSKVGDHWYAVGVARDITARKKIDMEVQKRTLELEKMNRLMVDRELKMVELKKTLSGKNSV